MKVYDFCVVVRRGSSSTALADVSEDEHLHRGMVTGALENRAGEGIGEAAPQQFKHRRVMMGTSAKAG